MQATAAAAKLLTIAFRQPGNPKRGHGPRTHFRGCPPLIGLWVAHVVWGMAFSSSPHHETQGAYLQPPAVREETDLEYYRLEKTRRRFPYSPFTTVQEPEPHIASRTMDDAHVLADTILHCSLAPERLHRLAPGLLPLLDTLDVLEYPGPGHCLRPIVHRLLFFRFARHSF